MPTTQSSKTKSTAPKTATAKAPDAIKLLEADHKEVRALFKDYDHTESAAKKAKLSETICLALKVPYRSRCSRAGNPTPLTNSSRLARAM